MTTAGNHKATVVLDGQSEGLNKAAREGQREEDLWASGPARGRS